jgi:peptidyl-prolyl cis-trans isomerase D
VLQTFRSFGKYIFWGLALAFVGGFLFYESSGLFGRDTGPTVGSTVISVNGQDVTYGAWQRAVEQAVQEASQNRSVSLDERASIEEKTFNDVVTDLLLQQEYKKRGISVSTEEITEYAKFAPPQQVLQVPDLQTDGRFDVQKYQRYLQSPAARQSGLLLYLENYYRAEIPKQKLFEQIAAGAFVSDARLWQLYQDQNDSAQISFVSMRPTTVDMKSVTDAQARAWYDAHKQEYDRPGRASLSVISIPTTVTAADSAATRDSVAALRAQIVAAADQKAKFAELATLVSADSTSATNGGELGAGGRGRFVPQFEDAAYALAVGQVSAPVRTDFGWHIIRLDERKGDTLTLRHILLKPGQDERAAAATARRADSVAKVAADLLDKPAQFDSAAKRFGLPVMRAPVFEGNPATIAGQYIPDVSAWAFSGARVGETSDMRDSETGYYIARLDSLFPKGIAPFEEVKEQVKERLAAEKVKDEFVTLGNAMSSTAAASSFENAAKLRALSLTQSRPFTRTMPVDGIGSLNEAIGAAFSLPIGATSKAIRTNDGVYVIRVDRRTPASREAFEKQKGAQREQVLRGMRQQMVADFLEGLRKSASIDDRRKQLSAAARRQSA